MIQCLSQNPCSKQFCVWQNTCTYVCLFVCLGLTSLSAIFQSYQDGAWLRQGAQCSLLYEVSCHRLDLPINIHVIPPWSSGSSLKWAIKFLLNHTTFYQNFEISLIWMKNFLIYSIHFSLTSLKWKENLPDAPLKHITCMYLSSYTAIRPHGHSRQMRCQTEIGWKLMKRQGKSNQWHDTTPSHIILTLGRQVLVLPPSPSAKQGAASGLQLVPFLMTLVCDFAMAQDQTHGLPFHEGHSSN